MSDNIVARSRRALRHAIHPRWHFTIRLRHWFPLFPLKHRRQRHRYFKNNVPPCRPPLSLRLAPMPNPTPISSPLPAKCKYHGSIFVPPQERLKVTISPRSAPPSLILPRVKPQSDDVRFLTPPIFMVRKELFSALLLMLCSARRVFGAPIRIYFGPVNITILGQPIHFGL